MNDESFSKQCFDAKLIESSNLHQKLNIVEQKLKETMSILSDLIKEYMNLQEEKKKSSSEEDIPKYIKQIDELKRENENLKQANELKNIRLDEEEIITRRQLANQTNEINQLKQNLNESNELISKLKSDLSEALRDKTAQFEQFTRQETISLDRIKSLESKIETTLKEIQNLREINVKLESDSTQLKEIINSLEIRLDLQAQTSENSQDNTFCLNRLKELYERFNCELLVTTEKQQECELSISYYVEKLFDLLKNYKIKINKLNNDLDEQTRELIKCKNDIIRSQTVINQLTLKNQELNYPFSRLTNKQAELNETIKSSSSGDFNDLIDLTRVGTNT